MRVGIYARVSTGEQQSIPLQVNKLREYATIRGWTVNMTCEEVASGALSNRPQQAALIKAAHKREIDAILVWRLDRWSRDLGPLITSINELLAFGVAFISYTETMDFSTPQGRAMAGMIGVFANFERDVLNDRVKAGIADAKRRGVQFGRPHTIKEASKLEMKALSESGKTHLEIAKMLGVGRTSVLRILGPSSAKRGRRPKIQSTQNIEPLLEIKVTDSVENLPTVIPEKVCFAEVTEDKPKSIWEIEAEAASAYRWSEEGIREYYPGRNQRLPYMEFGNNFEYDRIRKFLVEKQDLIEAGWTSGAIEKLLGKPHFVIAHRDYLPWHFWFKSDAESIQGKSDFGKAVHRSLMAKELKVRADQTKLKNLQDHLSKSKIKVPKIPFRQLISEVCEVENKRRSRKKYDYAEWECHLNIHSDVEELYELSRKYLHKKMELISGQMLSLFGAKGIREAQNEMYKVIDLEIRKILTSYSAFSHL
jgi:DNA invertase Pin-like site-specific DNA recombinase